MGWNRIIFALPVQSYKCPTAALRDRHLREEEKEAEDGPRWPQSSRWEHTLISSKDPIPSSCPLTLTFYSLSPRFLCECIIWEIEYGRDRDFGGLLRDCRQANPNWLYPIWTAAVLPEPLSQPSDCFRNLYFQFPHVQTTLFIPHTF